MEKKILFNSAKFQKSQVKFDRKIRQIANSAEGCCAKMHLSLAAGRQDAFAVFLEQYKRTLGVLAKMYKDRIVYLSAVEKILSESFPELEEKVHNLKELKHHTRMRLATSFGHIINK